jgi:hypothetical protein
MAFLLMFMPCLAYVSASLSYSFDKQEGQAIEINVDFLFCMHFLICAMADSSVHFSDCGPPENDVVVGDPGSMSLPSPDHFQH